MKLRLSLFLILLEAMNQLDEPKQFSTVSSVGDLLQLAQHAQCDATSDSLSTLRVEQSCDHERLPGDTVAAHTTTVLEEIVDQVLVCFGLGIPRCVPGCGFTSVDSCCQGLACGEGGVQLISPTEVRIFDRHGKSADAAGDEAANADMNDLGMKLVVRIYNYYRKYGAPTEVIGTKFRNIGQIQALSYSEPKFRYALNLHAVAMQELDEGMRPFVADAAKLDRMVEALR